MCDSSPEAFRIARSLLLVPEVQVKHKTVDRRNRDEDDDDDDDDDEDEEQGSDTSGGEEDSDDDANSEDDGDDKEQEEHRPRVPSTSVAAIPTTTSVKRLRAKYATCTHCAAEYDVTDNRNDSCTWHPGTLEPDYRADIWADHDEACHGRIGDLADAVPEGFRYRCCDRVGVAGGCRVGTHVARGSAHKRARY